MADVPALDAISLSGTGEFYADFTAILRAHKGIDRSYQLGRPNTDLFLPNFKKTLALFNKKYKDIYLVMKKNASSVELQITFLGEETLQTLFANSASRIKGLSMIGLRKFDEIPIGEHDKVEKALTKMGKRIYVSYLDPETGTSRMLFEKHGKSVQFICSRKDIFIRTSPEFRLCAYYSLRHPYNKKIDVISHASSFGFGESIGLDPHDFNDEFETFSRIY
jgi:hypothetical protein